MEKERGVYIGNGQTITVTPNMEVTYVLNVAKLERLLEENPDKEVMCGASGDWFWTGQTITKEKLEEIKNKGGSLLRNSCWSRFEVQIEGEAQDCTLEVPKDMFDAVYNAGFWRGVGKVEFWLPEIFTGVIKNLKYEQLKELQNEINPILKKYMESSTS